MKPVIPATLRSREVAFIAGSLGVIGALTLVPTDNEIITRGICVLCGASGLSDFTANILLFVPLGISLKNAGRTRGAAFLIGLVVTCLIEAAQTRIPGRDPGLGDLISNSTGTLAGWYLLATMEWWRFPTPRRARVFRVVSLVAACGAVFATGALLAPALTPTGRYYGEFAQTLDHGQWTGARADSVTLGDFTFPDWDLSETARVKALLIRHAPIEIWGRRGPPTSKPATLFTIYDHERQVPIRWIGAQGDNLVYTYLPVAANARLSYPDIHFDNVLGDSRSGALRVVVRKGSQGWCIRVDSSYSCELGYTAGSGWGFLWFSSAIPVRGRRLIDLLWLALLFVPFGFTTERTGDLLVGAGLAVTTLLTAPAITPLIATPVVQFGAAIAGIAAGRLARMKAHAFSMKDAVALYERVK